VEFDILYGQGISRSGDVIDLATDLNLVEKSGAWFSFQGERIGQGRDNSRTYLEQHPDILDKVESLLLAKHNIQRTSITAAGEAEKAEKGEKNEKGERATSSPPAKGASASSATAPSTPAKGPNSGAASAAATRPVTKGAN
jgi:recombination protein RecA